MAAKRKIDARTFAQQKRKRRQWLTFVRMCRYGVNNFSRNAWLTIAATAVMTITLLVVFTTLVARNVLVDTVGQIRDSVDMSIYVKTETLKEDVDKIEADLNRLESVTEVKYITPEEARADFAEQNKTDNGTLGAINEATNKFPGTFRVKVVDINDTTELRDFVGNNETFRANMDEKREPSFAGPRRAAIENIGRWVSFAERVGIGMSVLFAGISSLIVFNTIRMAIFNRKDEIAMMKLIGADRSFIRGPFVVEAVVYGFIAAVLATGAGVGLLYAVKEKLVTYGIMVQGTIELTTAYIGVVILGMILTGALIGVASSLLATHRYLKI